jgi:hypothetical protein
VLWQRSRMRMLADRVLAIIEAVIVTVNPFQGEDH